MEDRSVLSRAARQPDLALPNADVYFGNSRRPVAVLIHGGFWRPEYDRTHLRPMAAALSDAGWPVYSIEYRRIPGDPLATVKDVQAAVDAVGREMVLIGHSAGGHLALWAASRRRVLGTVALAPVADLTLARRLNLDDGAVADFLGVHQIGDFQPTAGGATLVHGTQDTLVPIALSQSYAATHPSSRLVPVAGAGHFALIDPLSVAWPTVIDELDRLLA